MLGNRKKVENFSFRQFAEMKMFSATYFRNWKKSRNAKRGGIFTLFYIIDFAGQSKQHIYFLTQPSPAFTFSPSLNALSNFLCEKWDSLFSFSRSFLLFIFHPFFIREKQQRISMYAYIYLILKIRGWNNIRLEKK